MVLTSPCNAMMSKVDEISRSFDCDPGHNKQVTSLALKIFDSLTLLHRYSENERRLLEIASRLHDIGWSRTVLKKHHKLSGRMIMEAEIPGLEYPDQLLCALIARYHTKALPNAIKHQRFASLTAKKRKIVEWLAAILRMADALDSSHTSVIKHIKLTVRKKVIVINLETNGDCWDEIRRVQTKQELLVKQTKREMIYQCL